jgi:cation diffusion facilitator CzcD-associated flavoprotein CzcO
MRSLSYSKLRSISALAVTLSRLHNMAFNVKDVAIVGAGPCGLAAAKYLISQKVFDKIVVYEQNDEVGGVWNYSKEPTQSLHVPQVSAFCPQDPPVKGSGDAPEYASPMYDHLHTNIPGPLMAYSDLDFPEGVEIFPSRQAVQSYLLKYAEDVRSRIRFSTIVEQVRLNALNGKDQWTVEAHSTVTGESTVEQFDAVVVASGHYSTTFIPDIKGIRDFHARHPGVISHSKAYRSPTPYTGKKVVVVGNSASGMDIAAQINRVCRHRLLLSVESETPPDNLAFIGAEEVPPIEQFLSEERGVRFKGGRTETDIDRIMFATGYLFSLPFLTSLSPPLVTNGRKVHGLYKDLIHIDHPTLVFVGLPIKVVPFPLAESQAALFTRIWANQIDLPSKEDMRRWEAEASQQRGPAYHVYPKGGDVEFINGTHELLAKSRTPGKEPPYWGQELRGQRGIYFEAKLKFDQQGQTAKSLQELGYSLDSLHKAAAPEKAGSPYSGG